MSATETLFTFTALDHPTVQRNLSDTDTILRLALGDTAKTTGLMMLLASGELPEVFITLYGVRIQVEKV